MKRPAGMILLLAALVAACSGTPTGLTALTTTTTAAPTTSAATTTTSPATTSTTTTTTTTLPPRLEPQVLAYGLDDAYGLRYETALTSAVRASVDAAGEAAFQGTGLEDSELTAEGAGSVRYFWSSRSSAEGEFDVTSDTAFESLHVRGVVEGVPVDTTLSPQESAGTPSYYSPRSFPIDRSGTVVEQAADGVSLLEFHSPASLDRILTPGWVGPPLPDYPVDEGDTWAASFDTPLPFGDLGPPVTTEVEATVVRQEVYDGTPVLVIEATYRTGGYEWSMFEVLESLAAAPEEAGGFGMSPEEVEQMLAELEATETDVFYSVEASTSTASLRFDPATGVVLTRSDTVHEAVTITMVAPQGEARAVM